MKNFDPKKSVKLLKEAASINKSRTITSLGTPTKKHEPFDNGSFNLIKPLKNINSVPFNIRREVHITPKQLEKFKTNSHREKMFSKIGENISQSLNGHTAYPKKEDIEKFVDEHIKAHAEHQEKGRLHRTPVTPRINTKNTDKGIC
jgi:hypothetical protein